MKEKRIKSDTITGRIYEKALEILDQKPEGIRWKDLNQAIQEAYSEFHPKTINGCVWKLTEKFPDKVFKPSKGVFRLLKHSN